MPTQSKRKKSSNLVQPDLSSLSQSVSQIPSQTDPTFDPQSASKDLQFDPTVTPQSASQFESQMPSQTPHQTPQDFQFESQMPSQTSHQTPQEPSLPNLTCGKNKSSVEPNRLAGSPIDLVETESETDESSTLSYFHPSERPDRRSTSLRQKRRRELARQRNRVLHQQMEGDQDEPDEMSSSNG